MNQNFPVRLISWFVLLDPAHRAGLSQNTPVNRKWRIWQKAEPVRYFNKVKAGEKEFFISYVFALKGLPTDE